MILEIILGCILFLFAVCCVYLIIVIEKPREYDLKGAHVLVTGGSSGIGKAVAEEAARCGANITLMARNKDRLEQAKDCIKQHFSEPDKQKVQCVVGDVSASYEAVKQAIDQAELELGPVDVLMNSAGSSIALKFEDIEISDFENVMNANFLGSVRTTKAVLDQMKKRRTGVIVYVSSMAGQIGVYGYTAYGASKFALRGLAESLQMEMKPYNVRVMLTFPPDTNTPMFKSENETKPEACALISESGGYFEPEAVGKHIVQDIKKGKFLSYQGFDGGMLATLTSGSAPAASVGEALIQVFSMGIIRLVMFGYQLSWRRIVQRCHQRSGQEESDKSE